MLMFKNYRSVFIVLLLLTGFSSDAQTRLSAQEFENAITTSDTVQVLDVRTHSEYTSSHLKNALLADWRDEKEFDRRISFIDKNKPVYVYCLGGGRSAEAAQKMRASGYNNVYELDGGINAWKAAGKPVEGNPNEKQMSLEEFERSVIIPGVVLVDFGADWCPPCKKMEPVIKAILEKNRGRLSILKVDGGRDQDLLKKYNVTALPVFILFKNGKQVWRKEGIFDENEIAGFLK